MPFSLLLPEVISQRAEKRASLSFGTCIKCWIRTSARPQNAFTHRRWDEVRGKKCSGVVFNFICCVALYATFTRLVNICSKWCETSRKGCTPPEGRIDHQGLNLYRRPIPISAWHPRQPATGILKIHCLGWRGSRNEFLFDTLTLSTYLHGK